MIGHHFTKDRLFLQHLNEQTPTPFEIKAFDFPINCCLSREGATAFTIKLVDAFDAFRSELFVASASEVVARISGQISPWIRFENVESVERDVEPISTFVALNRQKIDMLGGPTVCFFYYCSLHQNRSLLRILCSHFSFDLVTYRLVANALHHFARGDLCHNRGGSYLKWMDVYWQHARSPAGASEFDYWTSLSASSFSRVRGMLPVSENRQARKVSAKLSTPILASLRHASQYRWKCRLADTLAGSILGALAGELGVNELPVNWTAHGRFPVGGFNFSTTAGWLSNRHPVLVPFCGSHISESASSLRKTIQQIPAWGSTYAWVMRFCDEAQGSGLETALHAPVTINVRESTVLPPIAARTGKKCVPIVTCLPISKWCSASSMYIVIDIGLTAEMTITCVDLAGLADRAEKVMRSAVLSLFAESEVSTN